MRKTLSLIMVTVLCLCFASCTSATKDEDLWATAIYTENTELGNGEKTIVADVVAGEKTVTFTIHTDKENLGEALVELKLIDGENGPYGLYIKSVNGIVADYDKNQAYWAVEKNGESLMTGVDSEKTDNGGHYELIYIKI